MAAQDNTLEVMFADANNDSQKQLEQIDNFMVREVDCLVICPNDGDSIIEAVEKANAASIPVICFNMRANGGEFYYVGASNVDCGTLQGEYMAEVLPENAKILYLGGNSGYQISRERREGVLEGLSSRKDITILAEQECMYTMDEGMTITEDWIQAFPEFDAIITCNDLTALGAIQALKGADRLDGVMISGLDAIDDALAAVKAGEMTQTIMQNKDGQVQTLYDTIKEIQAGKTPEKDLNVPVLSITKENINEYL